MHGWHKRFSLDPKLLATSASSRANGLPLVGDAPDDHPKVQELGDAMLWSEGQVCTSSELAEWSAGRTAAIAKTRRIQRVAITIHLAERAERDHEAGFARDASPDRWPRGCSRR